MHVIKVRRRYCIAVPGHDRISKAIALVRLDPRLDAAASGKREQHEKQSRFANTAHGLFPYQLANTVLVLVLVARFVATVKITNVALAVDQHRARHLIDVICLAHLAGRI